MFHKAVIQIIVCYILDKLGWLKIYTVVIIIFISGAPLSCGKAVSLSCIVGNVGFRILELDPGLDINKSQDISAEILTS